MFAKHDQRYGPLFGVVQRPPEERGPWARARRQLAVRLERYRNDPEYRKRIQQHDAKRKSARTKMCGRCGHVAIRRDRITCVECTRTLKRRASWYDRAQLELAHHAYGGQNPAFEKKVKQLQQLRKEQPL